MAIWKLNLEKCSPTSILSQSYLVNPTYEFQNSIYAFYVKTFEQRPQLIKSHCVETLSREQFSYAHFSWISGRPITQFVSTHVRHGRRLTRNSRRRTIFEFLRVESVKNWLENVNFGVQNKAVLHGGHIQNKMRDPDSVRDVLIFKITGVIGNLRKSHQIQGIFWTDYTFDWSML